MTYKTKLKYILYAPFYLPHLFFFLFIGRKKKELIVSDVKRWGEYRKIVVPKAILQSLIGLLITERTFRNQFYMRIGLWSHILNVFLHEEHTILLSRHVGKGLCLIHSYSTIINGDAIIGENCTILHSVTIGGGKGGAPIIGNNVYIGAGAIIIGKVHIGNNVKIGAGAIVVEDIPDNATAVCEKARIIQH